MKQENKIEGNLDWSRFINGNRINRISDSERHVLKTSLFFLRFVYGYVQKRLFSLSGTMRN